MRWGRFFVPAAIAYVAVKVVLLAVLSVNTQYVMDEYAQAGFQLEELDSLYTSYDPVKTVLYIYYYRIATLFTETTAAHMTVARLLTLVLALITVLLTYRIARNLGRERPAAWLSVAVLLSFSTFMERSFRTRSDSLASCLVIAAAWAATRPRRRIPKARNPKARNPKARNPRARIPKARIPRALVAGLLAGLAFACTQKSVYFLAALGIGYLAGVVFGGDRGSAWRRAFLFGAGWGAVLLAYSVYFGGGDFLDVLRMVFVSPMSVTFNAADYYSDFGRWVAQTLVRNVLAYAVCFIGLGIGLLRLRSTDEDHRTLLVATAVMAVLVFRHNQPWPYVFVVLLPLLSLWAPEVIERLVAPRRAAAAATVLLALLSFSLVRNVRYLEYDNDLQNEVTDRAESLLGPDDLYCDGVWMVVTRGTACTDWWDAMTYSSYWEELSAGDQTRLDEIFARRPKIWILNSRVGALWKFLEPRMNASYVEVYPNIIVAGAALFDAQTAEPFLAPWSGDYALYGADGRPLPAVSYSVDGRWTTGSTLLAQGSHTIAVDPGAGSGPRFLLPTGLELPPLIPPPGTHRVLFKDVYNR